MRNEKRTRKQTPVVILGRRTEDACLMHRCEQTTEMLVYTDCNLMETSFEGNRIAAHSRDKRVGVVEYCLLA